MRSPGLTEARGCLITIVPAVPDRAPGIPWTVKRNLLSDFMATPLVNEEPDLEMMHYVAKEG